MSAARHVTGMAALLLGWVSALCSAAAPPRPRAKPAKPTEKAAKSSAKPATKIEVPEVAQMAWAIARGSHMGPGEGWFRGGQSRYDFKWLMKRFDADHNGKISKQEFRGPAAWFERLDRNHDGVLTAEDFDWSDKPTDGAAQARALLQLLDNQGDGRITRQQWSAFFDKAAHGKSYVTAEDLQEAAAAILAPPPNAPQKNDSPSPLILVKGLLTGEIGSFHEGPKVGEFAPDFDLKTEDGKQSYRLSSYRGHKPVVLIFGSFT
ncbi:MAG TPA: EF-hand domain-containing protein [Gemmataceae bacterium]|nr:EF-hand domain-containing protein [Gemmataceae bacterium]